MSDEDQFSNSDEYSHCSESEDNHENNSNQKEEYLSQGCQSPSTTKEPLTVEEAETLFLEELKEKKVLMWCSRCDDEIYYFNPIVSKVIHHYRPGGTTYFTSGNCSKCHKFTWEHFNFERKEIYESIPNFRWGDLELKA